jgi:hypothetical protein
MLNEIYRNNMLVLTGILNRVPDQVKPSIQQAIHATGQLNTEKPTDSNQLGKPEEPPVPGQPSNMEKPGNVESPVYDDILDDGTLEGEKPGQYWEFDQDEGLGLDGILGGTSHPVPTGEPGNGSQPYGGGQPDGGGRPENPGGNPDMPGRGH